MTASLEVAGLTVPATTLDWLLSEENPAVAVLTRRALLDLPDGAASAALWARRGEYAPVRDILDAQRPDGTWDVPSRDYQKYGGNLWQVIFLGELWADEGDERIRRAADYAFSRQVDDGSWSVNAKPKSSLPYLTANVGRALARLGYERDERVVQALAYEANVHRDNGFLACPAGGTAFTLNGYCHMAAPKLLLFLAEVPRELWPDGAEALRDECIRVLRAKEIFRCLPAEYREFEPLIYAAKGAEREEVRARFLAEHKPLHHRDKPGWLRFGFPVSYNSDALEALAALDAVGEGRRPEYEPALDLVRDSADAEARWILRNSFNDRMRGKVEKKGAPSRWLTLRALRVLRHFSTSHPAGKAA
jgi:hypothetical protein